MPAHPSDIIDPDQPGLNQFHPLVARWFEERVGQPTDVQKEAWPKIAAKEHLLITAPTGSGKTLAAFLWALNQLVTGEWPTGCTSVLYISPLRALNYDIQRNLLGPLGELRQVFEKVGEEFPHIRVLTRTGDTPQSDRRQMIRHPPEILISTPESLNLLLSSKGGRSILGSIATVILDECEMLTLKINQDGEEPVAYAHHGSLSLEIRTEVERKLKAGELRAVVRPFTLNRISTCCRKMRKKRRGGHPMKPAGKSGICCSRETGR